MSRVASSLSATSLLSYRQPSAYSGCCGGSGACHERGLSALAILCWVELYPAKLTPSKVKSFNVPTQLAEDAARGIFTLIVPRGAYTNLLDTYQVSMNVPVVHLSYLAREDPSAAATRKHRFPALYPSPTRLSKRLLDQMREADVLYVLFEDRRSYNAKFNGTALAEHDDALLVSFPAPTQ